jgi:hypothetical protein
VQLTETSTQAMRDRGLLIEQPAGRGVAALFNPGCYKMSSRLRILLSACESPAFVIATHHELRHHFSYMAGRANGTKRPAGSCL